MRDQLESNVYLMMVYFNVMIMSKAFQLNKVWHLNNPIRLKHSDSVNNNDEPEIHYTKSSTI